LVGIDGRIDWIVVVGRRPLPAPGLTLSGKPDVPLQLAGEGAIARGGVGGGIGRMERIHEARER